MSLGMIGGLIFKGWGGRYGVVRAVTVFAVAVGVAHLWQLKTEKRRLLEREREWKLIVIIVVEERWCVIV